MNKVIAVTANDDHSLDLTFNDGSAKTFDVKPYLDYEVFRELKDLDYFRQVRVAFGSVHDRRPSGQRPRISQRALLRLTLAAAWTST